MFVPLWLIVVAVMALSTLGAAAATGDECATPQPTDRWDEPPSRWQRVRTTLADGLIWIAALALAGGCMAAGWIIFR